MIWAIIVGVGVFVIYMGFPPLVEFFGELLSIATDGDILADQEPD